MRLHNIIKFKNYANLNMQLTSLNLLDQLLKWRTHEIFGSTRVCRQIYRRWDHVRWGEPFQRPLAANYASHAYNSNVFCAAE